MTPKFQRRTLCASLALTGIAALLPAAARAAPLPEGPINFIIPVPPAGGTDLTFRALMEASRKHLDRTVVVLNLPGAGGAVGLSQAAIKPANGLFLNSYTSEIFTLPVFQPLTFSGKDFRPIIMVNEDPACLVVSADSKYDSLESFLAAARAAPGRISVGNSGFGNIWHLSAAAFANKAGVDLLQIPYNGSAPTVQALLGNFIEAFVASPPEVLPQVQAGKMRVIAVMADKRSAILPDVPTLKEKGIDLSIGTWRAIGGPAGMSDEVVKQLHDGFAKGMQEKSFTDFMSSRGLTIRYMNTQEVSAFVAKERPQFEALAAEIKKTAKP
ncbi:tripartite tricarboxylate transporter substrate binding protein [Xylophilus rhododendri]|uniref:Tripartite tricarboxylate transporter substrate binding protein n=1 Tax=Xylophilus rhododendri TaxID=2697032 RepID=A0A857JB57_9BURK|nr:tripartite tricarboxylate transporter substrate binding protein [Xylophilus rhododendri]QHJ00444.1 tripartite tricarboxylate transporter substrate binding protein [Xylophilus rhododendri]